MRKFAIVTLLILCCVLLCACGDDLAIVPATPAETLTVYVCGAVENEGYVTVSQRSDVRSIIQAAGILPQSAMPQNYLSMVSSNTKTIVVEYVLDGETFSCVNVNGSLIVNRLPVENVDMQVVNKIADYIEANGKITNKTQLKTILGEEYSSDFYKFFVSVNDYEEDNK